MGFLFCISSGAQAQTLPGCNPPGSGIVEKYGYCARQTSETATGPKVRLINPELLTDSVGCDVGHAVLASKGKIPIDATNFAVAVTYKQVQSKNDTMGFGLSGIIPFVGGSLGLTLNSGFVETTNIAEKNTITANTGENLVDRHCRNTGYEQAVRTAKYSNWLNRFKGQLSNKRNYRMYDRGETTYTMEITTQNTVKAGFNLNFILLYTGARELTSAVTQIVEIKYTAPTGY